MRQIILDTETTGLNPAEGHRIIEIGCIELINRRKTGNHYHQYFNPQRDIDEGALAVHGITHQFLQNKPIFSDHIDELMNFLKDAEIIIHNAPFDVSFIDHELGLAKSKWKSIKKHCRIIDSLILARQLHVGQRNSLDALCKRYGVNNSDRELHGALLDANLLSQVYLAMTGGQSSLFDGFHHPVESVDDNISADIVVEKKVRKLKVLKANAEEIAQHDLQLKKMSEKGKCMWNKTGAEGAG